jgi:hypothetical protein
MAPSRSRWLARGRAAVRRGEPTHRCAPRDEQPTPRPRQRSRASPATTSGQDFTRDFRLYRLPRLPKNTWAMTNTMQTIPTSTPPQQRAWRRRTLLAFGLTAVMLVAFGMGIVIFRGNDASSTGTAASQQLASAQLASVTQSCQQWSGTSALAFGGGSSGTTRCTAMTDWMGQQLRNGSVTGAKMWGSAAALQATCEQWMAGSGSASGGTAAPAWCGPMANWMSQHMGSWSSWMMNGNMMGG